MTTMNLSIRGIDVEVEFEDEEIDHFSPETGHYTRTDGIYIVSIFHKGEDIGEIVGEAVWYDLKRKIDKELAKNDF